MKPNSAFLRSAVLVGAILLSSPIERASAQALTPHGMRFTAPFAFIVNGETLPGGTYDVRRTGSMPDMLEVYNVFSPRHAAIFTVEPGKRERNPELGTGVIFEGTGNQMVLRTIVGNLAWSTGAESVSASHDIRRLLDRPHRGVVTRFVPSNPAGSR